VENDIDVVHTNGSNDNRMAFYASLFCKKKFKVIYTKHNTYPIKGIVSHWRFNCFNDAAIFVADSIYKTIGIKRITTPVYVIENGINLNWWKKEAPIRTGQEHLTMITNTGLSLHKGWTYLTDAIADLPPDMKKRLKVIVIGMLELEEEQSKARTKCDIDFPGFMDDARPALEQADVGFVLSYNSETSSFACKEMMAMSLPMIVSDYSSLPQRVDKDCGWITQTRNAGSIKEALLKILALSPEDLNAMKRKARAKAEAEYAQEIMIDATNQVYVDIAG
jgi:glycosyltransferase involved in cell wall biosynthesis